MSIVDRGSAVVQLAARRFATGTDPWVDGGIGGDLDRDPLSALSIIRHQDGQQPVESALRSPPTPLPGAWFPSIDTSPSIRL